MKKNLNLLLGEVLDLVKSSKKFTIEQFPDVVREILLLHRIFAISSTLFSSIFTLASFIGLYTAYYSAACTTAYFCDRLVFIGLVVLLSFMALVGSLSYLARVFISPKLFIIEYLKDLS